MDINELVDSVLNEIEEDKIAEKRKMKELIDTKI